MALTQVNRGTTPNDNSADTLYVAFGKVNSNATSLDTTITTSSDSTFNGVKVGKGAGNISTNTVLGAIALNANTSGFDNTALGQSALSNNTVGGFNTAVGTLALQNNVSGVCNTAIGQSALKTLNCLANEGANTAVGWNTLFSTTTGTGNTASGHFAMYKNLTGYINVAIGFGALEENLYGRGNVAIGNLALRYNEGIFCTAIGSDALILSNTHSYSTGLGCNAQVNGDNEIQLGSGFTSCYTYGALNNRSDLRDKTEVRDTVLGLDFINELRPVDYKWDMREDYRTEKPSDLDVNATEEEKDAHKILMDEWYESVKIENLTHDGTHTRSRYHHGLIAQEVQDVIEASGVDFGGFQDHKINGGSDVFSIGYTELIAPMIKAIQELSAEIELLKNK